MDLGQYVDKMEESESYVPPCSLYPGDHPELDTSHFLDEEKIQMYQSLIGAMQWEEYIGRWDIQFAVMTMSSFRA